MKSFVGHIFKKVIGNGKVSPTIKSVKPFTNKKFDRFGFDKAKNPTDRANIVRKRESIKRMDKVTDLRKKREEGIKASKEMKRMVDTGRAKNVGGTVFHKGVPERKADGGRIGRRFGGDTMKKKTNVQKIKEAFGPRAKNLKSVDPKKQKGLSKLPKQVRNKMGYMKSGGRA